MKDHLTRRDLLSVGLSLAPVSLVPSSIFHAATLGSSQAAPEVASAADIAALVQYFHSHARDLLRPAAGVLRHPSISPSLPRAVYSSDLWDWDTLWTARGLFELARRTDDALLREQVAVHAQGSLTIFFDQQSTDGRIPMLITEKEADPLGCLRGPRPHEKNQAKPVMAQLALLIVEQTGAAEWMRVLMPKLQAFHASWTADNMTRTGLLVWGDDVAIGNDNDPTTFGRPYFSSANLLLNCFYHQDLQAAAELSRRLGMTSLHTAYVHRAEALSAAIHRHCWDARDEFFYTADVQCKDRRAELLPNLKPGMSMSWDSLQLRIRTFTGFLPMWCNITTPQQNAALARHLRDKTGLGANYGVRTLSAAEPMYSLAASSNPSNWLGPVWIIANYLVWSGLRKQGMRAEADAIAKSTFSMLARDLHRSGSLNEYYHPDTGEGLSHKGFMDWNLLVLEMI